MRRNNWKAPGTWWTGRHLTAKFFRKRARGSQVWFDLAGHSPEWQGEVVRAAQGFRYGIGHYCFRGICTKCVVKVKVTPPIGLALSSSPVDGALIDSAETAAKRQSQNISSGRGWYCPGIVHRRISYWHPVGHDGTVETNRTELPHEHCSTRIRWCRGNGAECPPG